MSQNNKQRSKRKKGFRQCHPRLKQPVSVVLGETRKEEEDSKEENDSGAEREEELASIKKVDAHKFSRRKVVSNWERYEEGQEYPNSEEEKEAEEEEKVLKELLRKEPKNTVLDRGRVKPEQDVKEFHQTYVLTKEEQEREYQPLPNSQNVAKSKKESSLRKADQSPRNIQLDQTLDALLQNDSKRGIALRNPVEISQSMSTREDKTQRDKNNLDKLLDELLSL